MTFEDRFPGADSAPLDGTWATAGQTYDLADIPQPGMFRSWWHLLPPLGLGLAWWAVIVIAIRWAWRRVR